jgi:hypothetical protein
LKGFSFWFSPVGSLTGSHFSDEVQRRSWRVFVPSTTLFKQTSQQTDTADLIPMNPLQHAELPREEPESKPYCIVGAGGLTSNVWKQARKTGEFRYQFNLFRTKRSGKVTNRFCPDDVLSLAKFVRVISQVLVDDGCITAEQRGLLVFLGTAMDEVLESPTVKNFDAESL